MNNARWFFTRFFVLILAVGPIFATTPTTQMKYGANNQSITCTLTSVTNTTVWGCAAIDNTTNVFLDALVFIKIKTAAAATSATGYLTLYAAGTADGGTTYSDGVSGTNASQTLTSPPNVKQIGFCNAVANSTTYNCGPFSVAGAFNGVLPDHWVLLVQNNTGATLDGTIGSAWYQGIQTQTPSI